MNVVTVKLVEVFARAAFTVAAAFLLPLDQAGQFGILVTLVGLFSFAMGWERHIDLQRSLIGLPPHRFDHAVIQAIRLYAFNWVVGLPIFCAALFWWARLPLPLVVLGALVVVAEQIAHQLYNLAVVERRYMPALQSVAAKNSLLALALGGVIAARPGALELTVVVWLWGVASILGSVVLIAIWSRAVARARSSDPSPRLGIFDQHRASATHFLIGLLAFLTLQFDRLVIGALLPLAEVGIYFRHLLLVSLVYQLFNIASFSRLIPRVFAAARDQAVPAMLRIVNREIAIVTTLALLGFAAALGIDFALSGAISARFALSYSLGAILLTGALLRVAADVRTLVLNAQRREDMVLRNQIAAFAVAAVALTGLTIAFGMIGAAVATILGSGTYLLLHRRSLHQLARAVSA